MLLLLVILLLLGLHNNVFLLIAHTSAVWPDRLHLSLYRIPPCVCVCSILCYVMLLLLTFGFEFDYESAFFVQPAVFGSGQRGERRSLHTAVWCQLWWCVCAMCVVWEEKLTLFTFPLPQPHAACCTPTCTWTHDHTYELCAGLLLVSCPFTLHPCFTLHIPQICCIQKSFHCFLHKIVPFFHLPNRTQHSPSGPTWGQ